VQFLQFVDAWVEWRDQVEPRRQEKAPPGLSLITTDSAILLFPVLGASVMVMSECCRFPVAARWPHPWSS
jgi:hypothetical protein